MSETNTGRESGEGGWMDVTIRIEQGRAMLAVDGCDIVSVELWRIDMLRRLRADLVDATYVSAA